MEKKNLKVTSVKLEDLTLYELNPREITEEQFKRLKKNIEHFGFLKPLVVNTREHEDFEEEEKRLTIIGGNMRFRALKRLGYAEVPVVKIDVSRQEEKVLNIALNRISGKWDVEKLEKMVYEISDDELDLDLDLTGLEEWEQRLYNPAEDEDIEDIEKIVGKTDKATYVLRIVFTEEEDILRATKALTGQSAYRSVVRGEKLLKLIDEYEQKKED